ncbi:PIN-like domain-containing protein [Myxococcus xanthus]|uniref:PIN like domain-containing protein n=1 Tax=Myxococcus xanthus TaxID=34 RepID=A0A7Y4ILU5_MYXXA|nr:PIN-like domain-containing protein [Myxococcus xanthus]NOJ81607.1 hypothetical protein [Myxococcus xanthus]NOJ89037.1 hypothetical protein [Myxococcus xanthus]
MLAVQSSVDLDVHQRVIANALQDHGTLVFIDTNVIAWIFRLNASAYQEFAAWLEHLVSNRRLAIPAWTVHEYNYHLLQDDSAFFLPHKSIGRQLQVSLAELARAAHLVLSEEYAAQLGHGSRDECLQKLEDSMSHIEKVASHLTKSDGSRRRERVLFMEHLIARTSLQSPLHALAEHAAGQARERYSSRLAPGYKDGGKETNASGDLIIWNELLAACASRSARSAVLITNDRKTDWAYTPSTVILANGKTVSGSNEQARRLKLPKPELIAEFEHHTGSRQFHILSIDSLVGILSSVQLNSYRAQQFRHLAHALLVDLARDPTEMALQWFLSNPEAVSEAIKGVCYWHYSPSEVDQDAFVAWATEQMKLSDPDAKKVHWSVVFCEFFI